MYTCKPSIYGASNIIDGQCGHGTVANVDVVVTNLTKT